MLSKVAGSEQSLFLASEHGEHNGSPQLCIRFPEALGGFYESGNIGRIVESAVINVIAVPRLPKAVPIQMRGDYYVLARERRIGTRTNGNQVVGLYIFVFDCERGAEPYCQREARKGATLPVKIQKILISMSGAFKKHFGISGIEPQGQAGRRCCTLISNRHCNCILDRPSRGLESIGAIDAEQSDRTRRRRRKHCPLTTFNSRRIHLHDDL